MNSCRCGKDHDFSFCTGKKCSVKRDCVRWTYNHDFSDEDFFTVGEFMNKQTGQCEYFMQRKTFSEAMDDILEDLRNS